MKANTNRMNKGNMLRYFIFIVYFVLLASACKKNEVAGESTVSGVVLDKSMMLLGVGENETITARELPGTAAIISANWTSSDNNVATVTDGRVTGIAYGTATITAISKNGKHKDVCTVTVSKTIALRSQIRWGDNVLINLKGEDTVTIDWGEGSKFETFSFQDYTSFRHFYAHTNISFITIKISGNNIKEFYCTSLILTNLDVSRNPELTGLYLDRNQLSSLDISGNPKLASLIIYSNQIQSLDMSENRELSRLTVSNCLLTSLDVSKNTKLSTLICNQNQITNLNLSASQFFLRILNCSNNQLTTEALNNLFESLHDFTFTNQEKIIYISNNPGADDCNRSIATNKGWSVR